MTLFHGPLDCDELTPYGLYEICLGCGAVFDTVTKRKRDFIAYVPAWRLDRERERHAATA